MVHRLKISFITSKEANEYIVDQLCENIAKSLLNDIEFRKEIGLNADLPGKMNTAG